LLKRYGVGSYRSARNEGKIAFLKRVGKTIRGYADQTHFEGCGDICRDPSGALSVDVVSLKSHAGCGTSGVCPSGFSNTGETIHSHGTDRNFRANMIDSIVNTDLREGSRISGQDLSTFAPQDYSSGPGFLATPTGLIYQPGRG